MHTTNEMRACPTTSRPVTTNGLESTTLAARSASRSRRFGPNLGEAIIRALALGAAARTIGRGTL